MGARLALAGYEVRIGFVSIHAPAWGATKIINPVLTGLLVSIHAPAWGATQCRRMDLGHGRRFNPRARMGRDQSRIIGYLGDYEFQSTRPHGARLTNAIS